MMSARDIGHVWQAGITNEAVLNMNVLSDMLEIRNGLKT